MHSQTLMQTVQPDQGDLLVEALVRHVQQLKNISGRRYSADLKNDLSICIDEIDELMDQIEDYFDVGD